MILPTKMENSDRVVNIDVDFGEDDASKMTGLKSALIARGVKEETVDDVIASHAIANLKVYFRAVAKAGMKTTKERPEPLTDEQIQAKVDEAIPGVSAEREAVSAEKKLTTAAKAFDLLSAEEQEAYIQQLRDKLKNAA